MTKSILVNKLRISNILFARGPIIFSLYKDLINEAVMTLHGLMNMKLANGNFTTSLGPLKRYTSLALATGCDFSTEYNIGSCLHYRKCLLK